MKKIYFLAASLVFGAMAFGQQNLGFESWGNASVPLEGGGTLPTDQPAPTNWETLNFVNADLSMAGIAGNAATDENGNVIVPASQETDSPSEGSSYIKLTSFSLTGLAMAGIPDGDYPSYAIQDFASTSQFETMSFDVKHNIDASDAALVLLQAININGTDTTFAGMALADFEGVQNTWGSVTLPIIWEDGVTPTHYTIILTSSEELLSDTPPAPAVGSWIAFDNIKFSGGSVSVEENTMASVKVFPNPAKDVVNFDAEGVNGTVTIASITGQVVANANINNFAKVSTTNLNNGVYIYTIRDMNGNVVKTNKLIIQK